ncbi:MAG: tetratricopeptide repeat protein [Methylomicrobium sp.]|nr:tetratricopeptide repeat protein [Methylomicrobium sp.]
MENKTRLVPPLVLLTLLAGCAGLPRDQVQTELPDDCPKLSAASLVEEQNRLGPLTDTPTLTCARIVLRNSQDPAVLSTSLASRLSLLLAEREMDQNQREKLAAEGVGFAEAALQQGGRGDGAVHYYLAANLGLSVREHMTQAMGSLGRLEDEMKQAVALSPDIDSGGPLRLLGMLYLKAPAWPNGIGDLDKALELLEKAAKEHPGHPLNHLFYAQALWADGDEANLTQIKAELAQAEKFLDEGDWGYNTKPWKNEFAEFAQEFQQAD